MRTVVLSLLLLAVVGCDCSAPSNLDGGTGGGAAGGGGGGGAGGGGGGAGGGGATGGGAGGGGGGGTLDAGCRPGPVRVLVLLDQSGSMCMTDPPGGAAGSFCSMFAPDGGALVPARIRALNALFTAFQARPEVSVRVVPFDKDVLAAWPGDGGFAQPDSTLTAFLDSQPSTLGTGADYQFVLSDAVRAVEADVDANPDLARSRYLVLLITDGPPFPRCASDDAMAMYADWTAPNGVWADSSPQDCNEDGGTIANPDFTPGGDYNQLSALHFAVTLMDSYARQHGADAFVFDAVLLHNKAAIQSCGILCEGIYGSYTNAASSQYPLAALTILRFTLQDLTSAGGGTVTEFLDSAIENMNLDGIDAGAVACP